MAAGHCRRAGAGHRRRAGGAQHPAGRTFPGQPDRRADLPQRPERPDRADRGQSLRRGGAARCAAVRPAGRVPDDPARGGRLEPRRMAVEPAGDRHLRRAPRDAGADPRIPADRGRRTDPARLRHRGGRLHDRPAHARTRHCRGPSATRRSERERHRHRQAPDARCGRRAGRARPAGATARRRARWRRFRSLLRSCCGRRWPAGSIGGPRPCLYRAAARRWNLVAMDRRTAGAQRRRARGGHARNQPGGPLRPAGQVRSVRFSLRHPRARAGR